MAFNLRLVCACACTLVSSAQNPVSITGIVTGPAGETYSTVFLILTNAATGASRSARGGARGSYAFSGLASGSYNLTVMVPGMKTFLKSAIAVTAGQTQNIDVRLEYGPSLGTAGEDPEAIAAEFINRPPPPSGPAPRGLDGRPDFSGVWVGGPASLPKLDMLPWASALAAERISNNAKDLPMTYCLPSGPVPLLWPGWFEIIQTPRRLLTLLEADTPGFREAYLDGRTHPNDFGPGWLGHSIGAWEGDTLVIDTVGFHDRGWLDFEGHPHTDRLHVTQRLRRPTLGQLEIQIVIDDSGAYRQPVKTTKTAALAPEESIREYICNENNRDVSHMVGR